MDYQEVFGAAQDIRDEKNPIYGSMWDNWLITTLLDVSTAKALRSRNHYERGDFPNAIEEALDAINYLNKAVQQLTQGKGGAPPMTSTRGGGGGVEMTGEATSERRMHLATRLENMGKQLHGPHKGWLITQKSSVSSLLTLDEVEALVERLEKARVKRSPPMTCTQSRNRDSTRDELVEEIRQAICDSIWVALEWEVDTEPEDRPLTGVRSGIEKRDVIPLIALTLKAVVNRELELPNEVGRLEIKIIRLKGPRWIDSDNANDMCAWVVEKWKQGARQFIALRPTGTGEEEG